MTSSHKERKYLFDHNNFDLPEEPEVEIELDLPPPPPTFSLEEIGMAKDEGFSQGRLTGLEEAAASRAQYVSTQLEQIATELKGIMLAEQRREKTYENEVTGLCEAIFARAFPALNQQHGLTEVTSVIRHVITTQGGQSALIVEVPEGETDEIRAHLESSPDLDLRKVEFKESAAIERGSCRISWQNGGALRDHAALADEIASQLKQALAPAPQNPHNQTNGE